MEHVAQESSEAAKMNCCEILGGTSHVEEAIWAFENLDQSFGYGTDPEKVVRLLPHQSRAILALRDLGYRWREIDRFLGVPEAAARKLFEKELRSAIQIADHAELRVRSAHRDQRHREIAPFPEPHSSLKHR